MFVRFLWMLQTVKYPQRSKLSTFHTLSKVLKSHMSFNAVPILWLEGRAEWLGHPDIKMTANIYGHLDTKRKQGIAANMQRPLPAG